LEDNCWGAAPAEAECQGNILIDFRHSSIGGLQAIRETREIGYAGSFGKLRRWEEAERILAFEGRIMKLPKGTLTRRTFCRNRCGIGQRVILKWPMSEDHFKLIGVLLDRAS
jgi:hypothetical protein